MKKYFQFTTFRNRKNVRGFTLFMIVLVVVQYYDGMTIREIIIADFIIATLCIFETLIIDWVQMWNEKKKNREEK